MQDALSIAENYIAAGIKCVPIIKGEKKPYNDKWSTNFLTLDQFKAYSKPGDGIGIVTGKVSGIICIDIDKKHDGLIWYEANKDKLGNHILEKTPGGGYHLYYRYPDSTDYVPSSGSFAKGVEVMADGGRYVITAPSQHPNGGFYTIWNELLLSEVAHETDPPPDWILQALTAKQHKALEDPECNTTLDGDVPKAIEAISKMDGAIEGQTGDLKTYAAACKCRDYGLTQIQAFTVLKEHFNPRCKPPWDLPALKGKIKNAYKYGVNQPGAKLQEKQYTKTALAQFLGKPFPPRQHIIGPFVKQGLNMVYAPPGVGKTYFALSLAFAIATKSTFLNWQCEIKQSVIYFDGELPAYLLQDRLKELITKCPTEIEEPVLFEIVTPDEQKKQMPDLSSTIGQEAAMDLIGDNEFIVIDNISTLCRSGKENEAESWIPVQNWLLKLRTMGKSVLLVHHSGKGEILSPRGTSKREDTLDLVISLSHPMGYKGQEGCKFEMKFRKSRHFRSMADVSEVVASYTSARGWEMQGLEQTNRDKIRTLHGLKISQKDIAAQLGLSKSYVAEVIKDLKSREPQQDAEDDLPNWL